MSDTEEMVEIPTKETQELEKLKQKEQIRKEKLSKARLKSAQTKKKDLEKLKKKGQLFDKYLNNQLTYEDIEENGFKFSEIKEEKEKSIEKNSMSRKEYLRLLLNGEI